MTSPSKFCTQCREEKPLSAFYVRIRDRRRKVIYGKCKECEKARQRAYHARKRVKHARVIHDNYVSY